MAPLDGAARPTSRRANVDLPAPDGPITPSISPGASANERDLNSGSRAPGAAQLARSTESAPVGRGNGIAAGRASAPPAAIASRTRRYASAASMSWRQTPTACSTGASARPNMIEVAIIAPAVS